MKQIKNLLILLAIFCVIGSALAVSAAEDVSDEGGYAGCNYEDSNGVAGSQYNPDDEGVDQVAAVEHDANFVPDGTPADHAAGEPDNQTQENATTEQVYAPDTFNSVPTSQSVYDNATHNATASAGNTTSPQTMHATGNPILALLVVGAVLGAGSIMRKK